jgi:hypothetical protein
MRARCAAPVVRRDRATITTPVSTANTAETMMKNVLTQTERYPCD